jgi:hypothetical protein
MRSSECILAKRVGPAAREWYRAQAYFRALPEQRTGAMPRPGSICERDAAEDRQVSTIKIGTLVKKPAMGTGWLVVMPHPRMRRICLRHAEMQDVLDVHEDHPQRVLYAALRVQGSIARHRRWLGVLNLSDRPTTYT